MRKGFLGLLIASMMVVTLFTGCVGADDKADDAADTGAADAGTDTSGEAVDDSLVIGLSVGTVTDERWQRDINYFNDKAEELGFELVVQSADNDSQKQVSQCENLISSGVDVLIIQALDSDAAGVIANTAKEEGVPTIAYDRLIKNGDVDFYVSFDNVKVGEVQAQFVIDNAPTGNYIWLKGDQADNNAHLVYEGHKNVVQKYIDNGDITIVAEQWCDGWMPDNAMNHVENALTMANNDIQGILAPNDGTAGGAIQALSAQDLAGQVPIAGQDADIAACQRIVEGLQTGTVYKPTPKLNDVIIDMAVALAKGEDVKTVITEDRGVWAKTDNGFKEVDSYFIDVVAVSIDNMMETVIADGFHTMEEVYANVPQEDWPEQ